MKGGSTYQVWSHSDKHRRSFIELCSSDVITAKRPACLMYYVRTRYAHVRILAPPINDSYVCMQAYRCIVLYEYH